MGTHRYVIHGRRLVGPLWAPVANDTEIIEHDSHPLAITAAEALANQGFTVWMYERRPDPNAFAKYRLHVINTYQPAKHVQVGPGVVKST